MRYISRGIVMAIVLLLLSTSAASAQKPHTRKGFWIGFGFGWGSYTFSCDGCGDIDREGSYTGHIKLGGTINPHLLLGGETVAWSKSEGGATITAGNVSFNAYYYPQAGWWAVPERGGRFLSCRNQREWSQRRRDGAWILSGRRIRSPRGNEHLHRTERAVGLR